jgi:glycosyltransferase involved in cell wall biosynthesis
MKIALLADINSSHTLKWAKSLDDNSISVCIIGMSANNLEQYKQYPNITIFNLGLLNSSIKKETGFFSKLHYLKLIFKVKNILKEIKPDILHAHYASSYGLIGALTNFKPYIISVWGSDVFEFPKKSVIHKIILKYNLAKADKILSTSKIMGEETKKYTSKQIEITPFGIDTNIFYKQNKEKIFTQNEIVIGTVKSLEIVYGINFLLQAFKIVYEKHKNIKLLIVGGGSQEFELKELTKKMEIDEVTIFVGKIDFLDVPKYQNMIDIAVFASISESFGVSVLEAAACENPVIVSNVGGLPEIVDNNITGFIVQSKNIKEIATAIEALINNPKLAQKMGENGRKKVLSDYNWHNNLMQMINIYKNILKN